MRVKVMEEDLARLKAMAKDFGVKVRKNQRVAGLQIAIANAYLFEIDAESRRAMQNKYRPLYRGNFNF